MGPSGEIIAPELGAIQKFLFSEMLCFSSPSLMLRALFSIETLVIYIAIKVKIPET